MAAFITLTRATVRRGAIALTRATVGQTAVGGERGCARQHATKRARNRPGQGAVGDARASAPANFHKCVMKDCAVEGFVTVGTERDSLRLMEHRRGTDVVREPADAAARRRGHDDLDVVAIVVFTLVVAAAAVAAAAAGLRRRLPRRTATADPADRVALLLGQPDRACGGGAWRQCVQGISKRNRERDRRSPCRDDDDNAGSRPPSHRAAFFSRPGRQDLRGRESPRFDRPGKSSGTRVVVWDGDFLSLRDCA